MHQRDAAWAQLNIQISGELCETGITLQMPYIIANSQGNDSIFSYIAFTCIALYSGVMIASCYIAIPHVIYTIVVLIASCYLCLM